jgi:hypothetical protein
LVLWVGVLSSPHLQKTLVYPYRGFLFPPTKEYQDGEDRHWIFVLCERINKPHQILQNDENLPNVNKTKHPTKGGKKSTRWKDPSPGKRRIFQRGWIPRGIGTNQVLEPIPNCKMHIKYGVGKNTKNNT